jgi:hypothetical protein
MAHQILKRIPAMLGADCDRYETLRSVLNHLYTQSVQIFEREHTNRFSEFTEGLDPDWIAAFGHPSCMGDIEVRHMKRKTLKP